MQHLLLRIGRVVILMTLLGTALLWATPAAASCSPNDWGTIGNDTILCDAVNLPNSGNVAGNLGNDTIIINGFANQTLVSGDLAISPAGTTMPLGNGGNDTIIINNYVMGSVTGDMVIGNGGDDTIIINAPIDGEVYGDYVQGGNGGNDRIYINGSLNGVRADEVQGGGAGGNDYVELQDGARVQLPIDGEGGSDTLAFAFVTTSEEEEVELMGLLAAVSPGSGDITFRGITYSWQNFEQIVRVAPFSATPPPSDGRLNNFGTYGAVYAFEGEGIQVYAIDENSQGHLVAYISSDDLADLPDELEENMLLDISEDGKFAIYKLTTGEYQVNIGPFGDDGKVEVTTWTGIPATDIKRTEFFVNR